MLSEDFSLMTLTIEDKSCNMKVSQPIYKSQKLFVSRSPAARRLLGYATYRSLVWGSWDPVGKDRYERLSCQSCQSSRYLLNLRECALKGYYYYPPPGPPV